MKYSKSLDSFLVLQFVFVTLFCNVWMTTAKAADYPSKPITIVVGYSLWPLPAVSVTSLL